MDIHFLQAGVDRASTKGVQLRSRYFNSTGQYHEDDHGMEAGNGVSTGLSRVSFPGAKISKKDLNTDSSTNRVAPQHMRTLWQDLDMKTLLGKYQASFSWIISWITSKW